MKLTSLAIVILTIALSTPLHSQVQWLDEVIAVVDNDAILASELQNEVTLVAREMRSRDVAVPRESVFFRQVLERLIVQKIQLQLAKRRNLNVSEAQIDDAENDIARRNGMTSNQFTAQLVNEGVSYPNFRADLRKQLLLEQLQARELSQRINVTEAEIDNILDTQQKSSESNAEYRLRHILIKIPKGASEADISSLQQKANDLLAQANQGADFSELAVNNSASSRASEGGDLGWRTLARIPSLFSEATTKLEKGQVGELIRNSSGFHLIKLDDVRNSSENASIEWRSQHILIQDQDNAEQMIADLHEQLNAGADFEELATSNSEDQGSAVNKGNLGWAGQGRFVPEFETELAKLEPQQYSAPFKSRFGWHIIKLLETRKVDASTSAKRQQIRQQIALQKQEEILQNWLRELRDSVYVEYKSPNFDES